jgi:hypothetical protein
MPISPENRARYPKNWKSEVVPRIRARSGDNCECLGECGLFHYRVDGRQCDSEIMLNRREPIKCGAVNGQPHPVTGSKVVLTVGHLNHTPEDCRDEVLRHWCQRCHLRYDRTEHGRNARKTRFRMMGQEDLGV